MTIQFTPDELVRHAVQDQDQLRKAEEDLADAKGNFQGSVRKALAEGVPADRLAQELGLSRARIYQLRDGKR